VIRSLQSGYWLANDRLSADKLTIPVYNQH